MTELARSRRRRIARYEKVVLDIEMLGESYEWSSGGLLADGSWEQSDVPDTLVEHGHFITTEKYDGYVRGRGSWCSLRITFMPETPPVIERSWSNLPDPLPTALALPRSSADIEAELLVFPRTAENIPAWMRDQLTAEGLDVPHLDDSTDELVIGTDREAFELPVLPEEQRASTVAERQNAERREAKDRAVRVRDFAGYLAAPSTRGLDSAVGEHVNAYLKQAVAEGTYDRLLDASEVDAWPSLVDQLADDVAARVTGDDDLWQFPASTNGEESSHERAIKYEVSRRFDFANTTTGLELLRDYARELVRLQQLGWTLDRSRAVGQCIAAFTLPPHDQLSVYWTYDHLQILLDSGVGVRGVGSTRQLFVLSATEDRLVPVDGIPPTTSDLQSEKVGALCRALLALRKIIGNNESTAYQKSMREAREGR